MVTIYALRDPRTWEVRYIGKTVYSIGERLCKHINRALRGHRSHKHNWFRQLLAAGLEPIPEILEELPSDCDWEEAEIWWIAEGRRQGWPLTNQTDGGGGMRPTEKVRAKMRVAWVARRERGVSLETRARMSASRKGEKHNAAWVEAQRQTLLGRSLSAETKTKIRAAQLGEKSWCAKLTDADIIEMREWYFSSNVRQEEIAARYGISNSRVSQIVTGKAWQHVGGFTGKRKRAPASKESRNKRATALVGKKNRQAKLTDDKVGEIRDRYAAGEASLMGLAGEYDVSYGTVRRVVRGQSWGHVGGPIGLRSRPPVSGETRLKLSTASSGERSVFAKLTSEEVVEIRSRYAAGGILQRELAEEYRVGVLAISRVINYVTWRNVQ